MKASTAVSLVHGARDCEELLDAGDLARWLKISRRQVLRLPIPRLRLGERKLFRWRQSDVRSWIDEQVRGVR